MTNVQKTEEQNRQFANDQKETIRQQVIEYRKAKGISQAKFCEQSGAISDGYLSQVESGKWDAIADSMWLKLSSYLSSRQPEQLFKTVDLRACFEALKKAQNNCLMIGLTADTGIGKTTALTAYANQRNVFYVVYGKSMRPRQFLRAVLAELGVSYEGSLYDMVLRIAEELNALQSPLLIIDEAGKMPDSTIMYMQEIRDRTMNSCGIALAGMPYFRDNLDKLSRKGKQGYSEFYRRIQLWQTLNGLQPAEIKYICESNGITGRDELRSMNVHKRFADLQNAILLHHLQNADTDANDN